VTKQDPTDTPNAILQTDPLKRLDAIIRRHGGKPKVDASPVGKVQFPPLGKRECEDQMPFEFSEPPL
jgi:hypothetical protein